MEGDLQIFEFTLMVTGQCLTSLFWLVSKFFHFLDLDTPLTIIFLKFRLKPKWCRTNTRSCPGGLSSSLCTLLQNYWAFLRFSLQTMQHNTGLGLNTDKTLELFQNRIFCQFAVLGTLRYCTVQSDQVQSVATYLQTGLYGHSWGSSEDAVSHNL